MNQSSLKYHLHHHHHQQQFNYRKTKLSFYFIFQKLNAITETMNIIQDQSTTQEKRLERELTERGRQAGARSRRVHSWLRLQGELRSHPYRRHGAAPDPPNCARYECGTWR